MLEINKKNARIWSRLGPRAVYGMVLQDIIERTENVYALSADLGNSSGLRRLLELYPERMLNVGIAEQNLMGVAAGFAKEGLVPFVSSFAPFVVHRCADQIRMNMGYMHLNIKAVGLGSGVSMSIMGNSHYGLEDLAFLRTIPDMTILSPCDCVELVKCVEAASLSEGPVYIRMTGEPGMPIVYDEDFEYEIGKAKVLKEGKDILLIATGSMVRVALEVAEKLEENEIECRVIDMHTIKPFDKTVLNDMGKDIRLVVTIEEHCVTGGLGSIVAEELAFKGSTPALLSLGLPDKYMKAGDYGYMLEESELTRDQIVKKIISRISKE